jgi:hypothetical protein
MILFVGVFGWSGFVRKSGGEPPHSRGYRVRWSGSVAAGEATRSMAARTAGETGLVRAIHARIEAKVAIFIEGIGGEGENGDVATG